VETKKLILCAALLLAGCPVTLEVPQLEEAEVDAGELKPEVASSARRIQIEIETDAGTDLENEEAIDISADAGMEAELVPTDGKTSYDFEGTWDVTLTPDDLQGCGMMPSEVEDHWSVTRIDDLYMDLRIVDLQVQITAMKQGSNTYAFTISEGVSGSIVMGPDGFDGQIIVSRCGSIVSVSGDLSPKP